MQNEKDNDSFLIAVSHDRYEMYARPTLKNQFIANLIKRQGGISDTVPPGMYVATVKNRGILHVELTIEPLIK